MDARVAEMGPCARLFVFVLFTQVMQALMSYDGGATQMSTQPLLASGWSSSELGLLGAMDKFGQVATAFVWSHLLMKHSTKLLLAVGLLAKAVSCLGFGLLHQKHLMLLSKLGMGISEALVGVWATVWVQSNAPKDSQARWLGFASISAGAGNGAGSMVAGLCCGRFGYGFAFYFQASLLFILWCIMLFTPAQLFEFCDHRRDTSLEDLQAAKMQTTPPRPPFRRSNSDRPELMMHTTIAQTMSEEGCGQCHSFLEVVNNNDISICESMRVVLTTPLWLYTAMAISFSCFITSSVAFLWQNTTQSVWRFTNEEATFSFLFTTGVGGLVGVALGPKVFDGYLGGFASADGRVLCLKWCTFATFGSVAMSMMCAFLFLDMGWRMVHYEVAYQSRGLFLAVVLSGIFLLFSLVNCMQGVLYGINTDSTTSETKSSAAGLTVSMQNIIGFAFGPLIPSMVADLVERLISDAYPEEDKLVVHSASFTTGMAVALVVTWLLLLSVYLAATDSARRSDGSDQRSDYSMSPLREEDEGHIGELDMTTEMTLGPL